MKSNNDFKKVYITIQLESASNALLTASAKRSNRKKVQEAKLRLEDHVRRFRSISEIDFVIPMEVETKS